MKNEPYNLTAIDPESHRSRAEALIRDFEEQLKSPDLREKVLSLIPIFKELRQLGKSLIPAELASAARDRILYYFRKYPEVIINSDELLVVSGIQEYARRVRELRVQFGWTIASGVTVKEMEETEDLDPELLKMKPSQYILLHAEQDREAALRWNLANNIRKQRKSVRAKILEFMRTNIGNPVTGEELRYVAGNRTEWARRVRELRTEHGWPIATKATGRPDLPVGAYVLQADRQSPTHDRNIPDDMRRAVLRRDAYECRNCGWTHEEWNPSDPRHLELHHIIHHAKGGSTEAKNLRTLCTVCHDVVHRM